MESGPALTAVAVPFLDLGPSHAPLKDAIVEDVADLIDANTYANGPAIAEFERAFADYCGSEHCVGVACGLDALRLALIARGVGPGDEVIVPATTFVASLEAVTQAGAKPRIVDASPEDWNLDPAAVEAAITPATRFLMPVHIYGQMADMRALDAIAQKRGIEILEDACQAHGAVRDGLRAGTVGFAGAFSFYPSKNLGAMGDAGALVTDDAALVEPMRALREHGQKKKYEHGVEGWTSRLDTIQAHVLLRKLPLLDEWNAARREAAAFYLEALRGVGGLTLPPVPPGSEPVWHVFVVRVADPGELGAFLAERRIGTGRHYPEAVHLSEAYAWLGHRRGEFPVAEGLADECLSLPMFPGITDEQLQAVANAVREYFDG
jgi:dTDP-3-amino-3,4,6-trideoxy-alpha-D-glucose transaminase